MATDIPEGVNVTAPPEVIVHPKRHAKCPVCHVKYRAGEHKRKCQREHKFKWFIYRIFHRKN